MEKEKKWLFKRLMAFWKMEGLGEEQEKSIWFWEKMNAGIAAFFLEENFLQKRKESFVPEPEKIKSVLQEDFLQKTVRIFVPEMGKMKSILEKDTGFARKDFSSERYDWGQSEKSSQMIWAELQQRERQETNFLVGNRNKTREKTVDLSEELSFLQQEREWILENPKEQRYEGLPENRSMVRFFGENIFAEEAGKDIEGYKEQQSIFSKEILQEERRKISVDSVLEKNRSMVQRKLLTEDTVGETEKIRSKQEKTDMHEAERPEMQKEKMQVDIDQLMSQFAKRLWEEREGSSRRIYR